MTAPTAGRRRHRPMRARRGPGVDYRRVMRCVDRRARTVEQLAELKREIRDELTRSESKANVVVTASGILLSALTTAALLARVPGPVTAVVVAAGVADAAATCVALLAVLPRLGRATTGWLRVAGLSGPEVLRRLAAARTVVGSAEHVGYLAGLARRKSWLVSIAVCLLILAVGQVVAAGAVLFAVGHRGVV